MSGVRFRTEDPIERITAARAASKAFADLAVSATRISSDVGSRHPEVGGMMTALIQTFKQTSKDFSDKADELEIQMLTDRGEAPCD